jgi:glycosyltransferase involved in cell wall biosynthesis
MSERIQLEREAGIQADAVIALSKSEREALITDYGLDPAKLAVIPNGVDLERFYEDPKAPVHRQA